jgi:hypothetical protein
MEGSGMLLGTLAVICIPVLSFVSNQSFQCVKQSSSLFDQALLHVKRMSSEKGKVQKA